MRVIIAAIVVLFAAAASAYGAEPALSRHSEARDQSPTADAAPTTLTGVVYDPLGMPIEGIVVSIENGPFGSGVSDETITDKAGKYTFERLAPGVYTIALAVDFAPTVDVSVDAGRVVRQDIRLRIEEVVGTFSVCVDCDPTAQRYTPPESLVREFASDRDTVSKQAVHGAEPLVGWEYYQPDVRVSGEIRERGLTGSVVLEARIEPDGAVTQVTIVSSPHQELSAVAVAALQRERWKPARVRGVPVAVPLRLTIAFTRLLEPWR